MTRPLLPALTLAVLLAACGTGGVGTAGVGTEGPSQAPTPTSTPVAEGPHAAAVAALDLARADWAAQGLTTYTYGLTRQCFCPPEATGPWTVTVEDDVVTAVTAADGSDVPLSGGFFEFGTIEDLHDLIGEMLEGPESTTPSGSFDAQGLPQGLYVDPEPMMADEEATFTVTLGQPDVDGPAVDEGVGSPASGSPASGSMAEPLSESVVWATGQPTDPAEVFTAEPVCGPTDELLGYTVTGEVPTGEPLADAQARLTGLGLDVTMGEGTLSAAGTTSTGAPVTITLDGTRATIVLELEQIPSGYDLPITSMCG